MNENSEGTSKQQYENFNRIELIRELDQTYDKHSKAYQTQLVLLELRNEAYEHSRAYKERTKRWHDAKIMDKEFHEGDEVLIFNLRLKLFPGKLKSRWDGPYTISKVFPYGTVKVCGSIYKEVEFEENERYKTSEEYHDVPPPYTGNFMPPKYDLILAEEGQYIFSESVTSIPDTATSEAKTVWFKT
ncbi:hypothetical protein Tco_1503873 [Tanacetum coccineum]